MSAPRLTACVLAVAVVACRTEEPPSGSNAGTSSGTPAMASGAQTASAAASADATPPEYPEGFLPDPDEPPPPPALDVGPNPRPLKPEDREVATLRLFYGDYEAERLALHATDDDKPVDLAVRDRLSPRRIRTAIPRRPPALRQTTITVEPDQDLPVPVVQRVVRQNYGRYRLCYENGLREDPNLAGTIRFSFVIGRDGKVSGLRDAGSAMANAAVKSCLLRGFAQLEFPKPERSTPQVTYGITFAPGG